MKVVIVEDDAGIRDALQMLFENSGFTVTVYSDGLAIVEGNFAIPDIFVIDKQLSGVDGLELCRLLKANAKCGHVPVIIISASPTISKLAAHAGASGFLEKPFKNKDLLQKVRELTDASVKGDLSQIPVT